MKSRTLQVIFEKVWKLAHILIWIWIFSSRTLKWYTFIFIFFFCLGPVLIVFTLPFHSTVGAIPFCLNHAILVDFPRKLGWSDCFFSSKKTCSLLIEPLKMQKRKGVGHTLILWGLFILCFSSFDLLPRCIELEHESIHWIFCSFSLNTKHCSYITSRLHLGNAISLRMHNSPCQRWAARPELFNKMACTTKFASCGASLTNIT